MLKLNQQLCDEMIAHGERDYPYECCGLLLGKFNERAEKQLIETYPISNAREEAAKRNRFLIRPDELLRGEQYAATRDLDVIGFYHSHPDHPAVPSQYDLEHAWPVYSYVVIAVRHRKFEAIRSWEMEPDRSKFAEEELINVEEKPISVSAD
jgi:proteasome lid subunit RPN8/RPN11